MLIAGTYVETDGPGRDNSRDRFIVIHARPSFPVRLVHADLSEYNILYVEGEPHIIDVGQVGHAQLPALAHMLLLFRLISQQRRSLDTIISSLGC